MTFARRAVLALSMFIALIALAPRASFAQCAGDCGSDLSAAPKTVAKFVKARWKAVLKCGKKNDPTCPVPCPLPDGTADPYLLSASCSGLIACNLDALAETAYGGSWNDTTVCAESEGTACGNVRAATAGKLVSTKLTRRRTNKMNIFPKDVTKCVAKIAKVPSCDTTICNDATDWIDEIFPLGIVPNGHQSVPFSVATAGEGVATLTMNTVGSDWAAAGTESIVVTYDLDGAPLGQLVIYNGGTPTDYRVLLGALSAGDHTIGLHYEKKLSPADKAVAVVDAAAAVEAIAPPDARYAFTRYAPILLGIDTDLNPVSGHLGNAVSDTPLIVYASADPGVGMTTYKYTLIWSNEDGGTGLNPDVLIAKFGRTTDIEGIVEVDVDDTTGDLIEARYRPDESGTLATYTSPLRGGTHPVVRTATANGLIQQDGASTLAFGLPPFAFDDAGVQRELGMDLDPVSYRIMAVEMVREGKTESDGNAATKKLSDARHYLYIDYDIDVSLSGQVLRGVAVVDGVTYYSDHALPFSAFENPRVADGIGRLAVELPPGTILGDIQQYGLQGIGTMSGTLASADAFLILNDYSLSTRLTSTGPQFQSGTNPFWLVTP